MSLSLDDLIRQLEVIKAEVGDGPPHEGIKNFVQVWLDDEEMDIDLEISEVRPSTTIGCGCWIGATILVKRVKDS